MAEHDLARDPDAKAVAARISPYDAVAPCFDRHRALPGGVAEAIRAAILASIKASSRPRLLDLGAGTGRIGLSFVTAGDDYVGVDLSLGMLREFARRADARGGPVPRLVQADGRALPFADATFDTVMLIQVIGAARGRRRLMAEVRRVVRSPGALVIGQTALPAAGLDGRMKQRLASFLEEIGVRPYHTNARDHAQHLAGSIARRGERVVAARWNAERTPRAFLDRQRTGAHFSRLPEPIKEQALRRLSAWAAATFGSLDAVSFEEHAFELRVFKFQEEAGY